MTATTSVPAPASRRWKPLRTGLVDIFYYDVEEFHFHDGRLLLRGNNGTGKSKVLALTLPFLLDGELSPHRVEPDGDRQKRMEWNLLLGGKHQHPERVGYTWMEFGRVRPDGTPEFRTVGCGLKAVRDRGIARHWYFVTPQRIGVDLHLLGPGRVPLTRERLREAVEGHGMVHERAADYRRAVDEALFGLGERRYQALVNLLIQLRQPQLSKKPDEKRLSTALTEALAPVSADLIRTVADAFRGLDEERHAIDALREAERAAAEFMRHYVRYAEVAAKRRVRGPRETQSRYEQLGRDLAEAERRYAEADGDLRAAQEKLARLAEERDQRRAQQKALEQSPEMRDAERLSHLKADAERLENYARTLSDDEARLREEAEGRRAVAERAESRRDAAADTFEAHRAAAREAADRARIGAEHQEAAGGWDADPGAARRRTEALAERQAAAVAELEQRLAAADKERSLLEAARREVDRLAADLQADAERIAGAEQAVGAESYALSQAYRSYLTSAAELRVPDPENVLSRLEAWAVNVDGPNPAAEAVDEVVQQITTELGRREAGLEAERDDCRATARELTEEIERLEAGGHDAPPVPHTRDPEARSGRPGAPLWKVVDFAGELRGELRAGLEAALEASGILDAWLCPDGALRGADDTVIVSSSGTGAAAGRTCADVLRPVVDPDDPQSAELSDDTVRSVLAAIGLGARRGWPRLGRHGRHVGQRRAHRLVAQAGRGVHRRGRPRAGPASHPGATAGRARRVRVLPRRPGCRAGRGGRQAAAVGCRTPGPPVGRRPARSARPARQRPRPAPRARAGPLGGGGDRP